MSSVAKADIIAVPKRTERSGRTNWPLHSVTAFLFLFLALFFLAPLLSVITTAFLQKGTGTFTLLNFYDFFQNDLFRRSATIAKNAHLNSSSSKSPCRLVPSIAPSALTTPSPPSSSSSQGRAPSLRVTRPWWIS